MGSNTVKVFVKPWTHHGSDLFITPDRPDPSMPSGWHTYETELVWQRSDNSTDIGFTAHGNYVGICSLSL